METIPLELRKLGLKENEVKVYLTGLELGPASVQTIALKAGLARPTTYGILKELLQKGLFIETTQGKKRYATAQSPEKILGILRLQKRELEEREREFMRIVASMETKYHTKDTGEWKLFKGKKGISLLEEELALALPARFSLLSSNLHSLRASRIRNLQKNLKNRLGKVMMEELELPELKGTLVVYEKAAFFPDGKEEGYQIEHPVFSALLRKLTKSLFRAMPALPRRT